MHSKYLSDNTSTKQVTLTLKNDFSPISLNATYLPIIKK